MGAAKLREWVSSFSAVLLRGSVKGRYFLHWKGDARAEPNGTAKVWRRGAGSEPPDKGFADLALPLGYRAPSAISSHSKPGGADRS